MRQEEKNRIRKLVYWGFSLVVTVAVFSYLFTHVTPGEVLEIIRKADRRGVAMFLVLSFSMSAFRTWRYRLALQTTGYVPPSAALFLLVLVRNFFSDLLPARIGTLVYIYIITTRLGVPFGAAASSFALSFLFDMIALAPMIAVAALAAGASTGLSAGALITGGAVLAAVTVGVLFALPYMFHLVSWVLDRLIALTRGRFVRWKEAWAAAEEDIRVARRSGIYLRMLVLSVLVRLGKYGSLYAFLYALARPLGYGVAKLPMPKVFLGLCSAELAASLPVSGIAGFGAYEGTWALVFQLLGFPGRLAKLTSISHHLFTQVYGYSLGALALVILLLPVFKRDRMLDKAAWRPASAWDFYARVAGASATVVALLALAYRGL